VAGREAEVDAEGRCAREGGVAERRTVLSVA